MIKNISSLFSQINNIYYPDLIKNILSLIIFIIIYMIIFFFIKKQSISNDKKIKQAVATRNTLFLFFLITTIIIWSGELKTLMFSTAAIFAAFLVTFKEIILSFTGSIMSNKLFSVGDYVEIDGQYGKIIDKNFIYTRILINSPYKNKELIMPNFTYLTSKTFNTSKYGKYQAYKLQFSVPSQQKIKQYALVAITSAKEAIGEHKIKMETYFKQKSLEQWNFEKPDINPILNYNLQDNKNLNFTIQYLAHPLEQQKIEEKIMNTYTDFLEKEIIGEKNDN